ncbi:MAG: hypothetical protein NVSMB6_20080 [Burkholderiaceae bacterium]
MTRLFRTIRRGAALGVLGTLVGCAASVVHPEWKANAQDALQRATTAFLQGNDNIERYEFAKAHDEVAQTGRGDLLGRLELARCAASVASLIFEPCAGFERVRQDAEPAEQAYAAFLAGTLTARDIALLPVQYHAVAAVGSAANSLTELRSISDPLSRLIAAAVLVRTAHASPEMLALATETASAQGWRRPLLAWLGAQVMVAERDGDQPTAVRLRRRMALASSHR